MAIYIGGTGDQNKLDDYEEGTWTPSIANGTFTAYNIQTAKINNCHSFAFQPS